MKNYGDRRSLLSGYVDTAPESFCACTKTILDPGLLFTHDNGNFGAISVTERSSVAPILKLEPVSHIGQVLIHTMPEYITRAVAVQP